MVLGLALSIQGREDRLFKRAQAVLSKERVLQTTSIGYEIKEQEDVKKFCSDEGEDVQKVRNPMDLDKKREAMSKRYNSIYDAVIAALKGDSNFDSNSVGKEAFKSAAIYGIIMAILSAGSTVFLIIWFITSCCCKKTCCVPEKRKDQSKACLNFIIWSGIVIALVAVILTIVWLVYMGKVAGNTKLITCTLAVLKSDFINGVKVPNKQPASYFIGSNGLSYTAQKFIEILDSIKDIKQSATVVNNYNLKDKATQSQNSFNSYQSSVNGSLSSYEYKGTQNPLVKVKIQSVNLISGKLSSISEEITLFKDAANQIADLARVITEYNDEGINAAKGNFENFKRLLTEHITDRFTSIFNSITGENGGTGTKQIGRTTRSSLIISAIIIVVPLAFYILIVLLNYFNKCHCLKFVNKIIMLIQIIWATLVFVYATVMVLLSVGMVVICRMMAKLSTEHRYLKNTIRDLPDGVFVELVDECLGPQGHGDILKVLGVEVDSFKQQETMGKGTIAFEGIKDKLSLSDPPISGAFRETIVGFQTAQTQDGPGTDDNEIHKGMERVNSNGCAMDLMKYKGGCLTPARSATTDTAITGLPDPFCFELSQYGPSYLGRYATSTCSSTTNAAGESELLRTLDSVSDYKSQMTNFLNGFDTGFYNDQKDLFQTLKSSINHLIAISTSLDNSVKIFTKFGSSIPQITDCSFLRGELVGIENVLCYEVGDNIFKQNSLALAVGSFLFFYAWCICCGVRCTVEEDKDDKAQGHQYENPSSKYQEYK